MKKVRLGIIGAGNMGSGHIGNYLKGLLPEIEIVAVADRRPDRRDWARENLGDKVAIFNEGSDLIASGLVDAILIAVPHYQHPVLAVDGFKHNLHVMCEKPAGVYTKQVREMNAEADKHPELVFGMMFNQRTNCVYRKIKEMIDGGELGKLKRVNWIITDWYRTQFYYDSGAWRATWDGEGGGVRVPMASSKETVELIAPKLVEAVGLEKGDKAFVMINGCGATTMMEMLILYKDAVRYLEGLGVEVVANMVGEILTVQEAGGFQMNIAKWDDEFVRLWNTSAHTPVFFKE